MRLIWYRRVAETKTLFQELCEEPTGSPSAAELITTENALPRHLAREL